MTITLRDVLASKGAGAVAVTPTALVSEAVGLMCRLSVGSVVVEQGGMLRGIFTERDVMSRIVARGVDPRATRVGEVMSRDVRCARLETTLDQAMRMMTSGRHRHLPVVEEARVFGLVSIGDLVKWVALDLEQHVSELAVLVAGPWAQPVLPELPPFHLLWEASSVRSRAGGGL